MPASDDPPQPGIIQRSPVVPALDGTHLNWLIATYIECCRIRLDNQTTVDSYGYHLRWFINWWEICGPQQKWLLRKDDFARFERDLRNAISDHTKRKLTYHTRETVIRRLREMLKWAFDNGYVNRDYRLWLPNAEGGPPKRKAVTLAALWKLLDVVGTGRHGIRNRAMVAMMMGMGLRRAEITHLDIEDVVMYADCSGHARVVGKRTRANADGSRDAAFDSATGEIIAAWLDELKRTSGPLFVGDDGKRLSGAGVYVMLKKAIHKAGLDDQIIGPHDLRRAFATHYRRNRTGKGSADLLQRQLGHKSFSQTSEYTLLDVDDIRADLVSPIALFREYTDDDSQ